VVSFRGFACLLLALTPAYLVLAAVLPPADDELYYWCWSQQLQLSYYDHPPMTAYMIRAATELFGDTLVAIRLPAILSTLTVLACIGWLTRPRHLLPLVILSPLFTVGAVLVTPDTPLLMFWALYVVWLVVVHQQVCRDPQETASNCAHASWSRLTLWLVGGLILGCGILGKYTTGLAVVAGFISFMLAGDWRRWAVGYAIHLAVAFVVTLPILLYNIEHDFAPLRYQWRHTMTSPEPGMIPFLSFVVVQVLLVGMLPFTVFGWAALNRRSLVADPRLRVCLCLFAVPFAFFLYKATRGPLEGNWALACYIAVWPLATVWYHSRESSAWQYFFRSGFLPPIVCVVLLASHLVEPLGVVPIGRDRVTRQRDKMTLAGDVAVAIQADGPACPVYVPTYQWTAMLRFHQIDARQIDGATRPSHFTQTPQRPADHDRLYVFSDAVLSDEYVPGFGPPRVVRRFPLVVRGRVVETYWLLEYNRSKGPAGRVGASPTPGRLDQPDPVRSP
jgi:hypothetical protein